ncbi:MAG: glycosyl hydrolase family 2, partial [Opitutaceae bacterium]|nr:glycosyl hydrolase family 2 [Opitutaceae bacterium]
ASDADGDKVTVEWRVVAESTDRRVGGDREAAPPEFPECIVEADERGALLRAPQKRGGYRVFCIVRDGKGGASADNFPFFVK